ncbi:hypothetical protein TNCV_5048241 [Trichonephila clavipes]|nr:hypothetical protein TNCV_5048241 [Trichonephila clavipes]
MQIPHPSGKNKNGEQEREVSRNATHVRCKLIAIDDKHKICTRNTFQGGDLYIVPQNHRLLLLGSTEIACASEAGGYRIGSHGMDHRRSS